MSADSSALQRTARSTLLCGAAMDQNADDVCLDAVDADGDEHVLWVSYTRAPEDCFSQLPDVSADRKAVVDVGGGTRSAAAAGTQQTTTDGGRVTGTDPNDLTGIGIGITDYLTVDAHVCFDSVTAMLQYVETKRAYTFLNSLLGHLWNANATAHFHFNPDAHDAETVAAVTSLFDRRVDVDGTVTTRE